MRTRNIITLIGLLFAGVSANAHTVTHPVTTEDLDTIRQKISALSKVHLGGYGEANFNYDFSGININKGDGLLEDTKGHSNFSIPRIVLMLGVNLGKGWGVETDIQFENCKKVGIDQFWIEKLFRPEAGLRIGYFTLPVGATNAHDDPMEFFGVNRPEGEDAMLPCDWHQAGVSFYGEKSDWGYEAIIIPGAVKSLFSESEWLGLSGSDNFTYKKGNDFGVIGRVDNTSIEGLRVSMSGYWGVSGNNTIPFADNHKEKIRGNVGLLSIEFVYDNLGLVMRGNGNWCRYSKKTVFTEGPGKNIRRGSRDMASTAFEAGYNILENLGMHSESLYNQKLYFFGRYEYWQGAEEAETFLGFNWRNTQKMTFGINYKPINDVVIKVDYSHTFLSHREGIPMLSLGVAYSGQFF